MLSEKRPIRAEEQDAAIQCAAIAFDDADDKLDPAIASHLADEIDRGARDVDRALPVSDEIVFALSCAIADSCTEIESFRVAADKCFGKHRELSSSGRCVGRQVGKFRQCLICVESDGSCLNHSYFETRRRSRMSANGWHVFPPNAEECVSLNYLGGNFPPPVHIICIYPLY